MNNHIKAINSNEFSYLANKIENHFIYYLFIVIILIEKKR